jgi:response regulator of citrate/malate metabolism
MIGPIRSNHASGQEKSKNKVDQRFLAISERAGISVNTVFRLHNILEQQGRTRFTTVELAELTGVTSRTMNRIIDKLAAHGLCFEVGKRVLAKAGRPSRIIEIRMV